MSSWEVQLAIYDLSQGMARGLSAQFLGPAHAIEIIPHTGIVVYGREYFFGAGIQSEPPDLFRRNTGLYPIQVLSLGRTTITQVQFETWCSTMMAEGRYSAAAYDLLSRNCNNFSHDAALQGLQLLTGVPQWIMDVPGRFLSSPMGQMIRPMLQNMQLTNVEGADHIGVPAIIPSTHPPSANPWADIIPSPINSQSMELIPPTPKIDSFSKPLLANDKNTVPLCVKKIRTNLNRADQDSLEQFSNLLMNNEPIDSALAKQICASIQSCLDTDTSAVTFALMLLRVVILKATSEDAMECINWIKTNLFAEEGPIQSYPPARAMAWMCFANWIAKSYSDSFVDEMIDLAITDLPKASQPRPEVRQAASAFLFNALLTKQRNGNVATGDLSVVEIAILCSALESLGEEPDSTVRLRRLMIAGRIIKPGGTINIACANLVQDLELVDTIKLISQNETDKQTKELASELLLLL